jgi:hypothetical protein
VLIAIEARVDKIVYRKVLTLDPFHMLLDSLQWHGVETLQHYNLADFHKLDWYIVICWIKIKQIRYRPAIPRITLILLISAFDVLPAHN